MSMNVLNLKWKSKTKMTKRKRKRKQPKKVYLTNLKQIAREHNSSNNNNNNNNNIPNTKPNSCLIDWFNRSFDIISQWLQRIIARKGIFTTGILASQRVESQNSILATQTNKATTMVDVYKITNKLHHPKKRK